MLLYVLAGTDDVQLVISRERNWSPARAETVFNKQWSLSGFGLFFTEAVRLAIRSANNSLKLMIRLLR